MRKLLVFLIFVGLGLSPAAISAETPTAAAEAAVVFSPETEIVTAALPPKLAVNAAGRAGELRLALDGDGDPRGTQYAVREVTSGKFVDFLSGRLVAEPVWGTDLDWGSRQGVIVQVGAIPSPRFVGLARNSVGTVSLPSLEVSPTGSYRVSRDCVLSVTEGVMYGLGILLFGGLAAYQIYRLRQKPKQAAKKSRR